MKAIWKFVVPLNKVTDIVAIKVPPGARFLSVQNQGENPCFWFAVTPAEPTEERRFLCIGTGNPAPDEIMTKPFLGTVQGLYRYNSGFATSRSWRLRTRPNNFFIAPRVCLEIA